MLRPGGRFVAFDPNRMNPFMWLYRDRSSPFYSPVGVTQNERPVLAPRRSRQRSAPRDSRSQTEYLLEPALPLHRIFPYALAAAGL